MLLCPVIGVLLVWWLLSVVSAAEVAHAYNLRIARRLAAAARVREPDDVLLDGPIAFDPARVRRLGYTRSEWAVVGAIVGVLSLALVVGVALLAVLG